jgi:hypothetical protein
LVKDRIQYNTIQYNTIQYPTPYLSWRKKSVNKSEVTSVCKIVQFRYIYIVIDCLKIIKN